jgi:hypothetical protein
MSQRVSDALSISKSLDGEQTPTDQTGSANSVSIRVLTHRRAFLKTPSLFSQTNRESLNRNRN